MRAAAGGHTRKTQHLTPQISLISMIKGGHGSLSAALSATPIGVPSPSLMRFRFCLPGFFFSALSPAQRRQSAFLQTHLPETP